MAAPKGTNWAKNDKLLGTMLDSELAAKLGISKQVVGARRKRMGIPPFTAGAAVKSATPEEKEELVLKPDEVTRPEKSPAKDRRRNSLAGAVEAADPAEVERVKAILGDVLSIEAVAAALGATVRTIQGYCKTKRLRGVKVGNSWVIPADALRRFMAGEE
jgi:excisionase family DNA binding protein